MQVENLLDQMQTSYENASNFNLASIHVQCNLDPPIEEASAADRFVLAALHLKHDKDNSLILHKSELDDLSSPPLTPRASTLRNSDGVLRQSSLESIISKSSSAGFRSEDFIRIDWVGVNDSAPDTDNKSITYIMVFRAAQLNISVDDSDSSKGTQCDAPHY